MGHKPTGVRDQAGERSRRIKDELRSRGGGLRALHEAVKKRLPAGARGASYGAVRALVEGKVDHPRPDVVRAIADELQVGFDYLMSLDGDRTAIDAALESRDVVDPQMAAILGALRAAERKLLHLRHDTSLGRDQVLTGLTVAFLQSGGRSVLSYTPEQVEEAMLTIAWLIYFPAEALGAVDFYNRAGGREEYFMAAATVLRIAMSGHDSGFPLNAIDGARALRQQWEARLPHKSSAAAQKELTRKRGRDPDQEDTDGEA